MKKTIIFMLCLCTGPLLARGAADEPSAERESATGVQVVDEKILKEKADALAAQLSAGLHVKELFDASFFRSNSLVKTVEFLSRLNREYGKVSKVTAEAYDPPDSAHFVFETVKGYLLPMTLSVNADSGLISGMFFKTPVRKNLTLAAIREQFAALPGTAGFVAVKLNQPETVLEALHSDEPFPISSLSKLYILGAVQQEGYSWKKVVPLKETSRSLPPGRMSLWPAGSPVTVHTLALGMIAENDNTAADVLADLIGRNKLEELLPELGHSDPGAMVPFLKTADVFRLKSDTARVLEYLNASLSERYWLLKRIAAEPLSVTGYKPGPFAMDRLGWHASPADLCRLMDLFRRVEDATAREILALEPGLDVPRGKFSYVGYKGGSEPGAVSGAWLLRKTNDEWYCLAGAWNSWKGEVDEKKFNGLMQSAVYSIGGQE